MITLKNKEYFKAITLQLEKEQTKPKAVKGSFCLPPAMLWGAGASAQLWRCSSRIPVAP